MKLIKDLQRNRVMIEVLTTADEPMEFFFPKEKLHYWYPLNHSFTYRYSNSRKMLYLTQENGYEGDNVYGAAPLKKSLKMTTRDGIQYHPEVFHRNMITMETARRLGIPTLEESYSLEEIEEGFKLIAEEIHKVKTKTEDTYIEAEEDATLFQTVPDDEWDEVVYRYLGEEDRKYLVELGEIYNMLVLMRKMHERR